MASSNNDEIISKASYHTIKKFELIESYIETWAQKLLQTDYCNEIVFIDCMCNSGVYYDDNGGKVYGTPVRVAKVLRDAAGQYPEKQVCICLNDNSEKKIALLKEQLPHEINNYHFYITTRDGNELLKELVSKLMTHSNLHYFLFYDPYDAEIDWYALAPFFRNWGEVMINHMLSDPIRAINQVKSEKAIRKYEETYLSNFEDLLPFGSDKIAYEERVEKIIMELNGDRNREYYIASFPFFNTKNSLLYDLIHCTSNLKGFKLYKKPLGKHLVTNHQ